MIVNMTLFFSNFGRVFKLPDSLDWFKKNETMLKHISKNFNQSLFFLQKLLPFVANYCFALKYAMIVNMTLFFSNFGRVFKFPDSLDWFKKMKRC